MTMHEYWQRVAAPLRWGGAHRLVTEQLPLLNLPEQQVPADQASQEHREIPKLSVHL